MATKKTARKASPSLSASMNRTFGKSTTRHASAVGFPERLPFGIAQIDWVTGGGLVLDRVSLFNGPESGTKTTSAIIATARYLDAFPDREALYVDLENKYPIAFSRALGLSQDRLVLSWPNSAELAVDQIDHAINGKTTGIIVIDSIAAAVTKIEQEAAAEDNQIGVAPRLINKLVRKIASAQNKWMTDRGWAPTVILINQERFKVGVKFGDPHTLPGGEGQKFHAVQRFRFRSVSIQPTDKIPKDAPIVKVALLMQKNSFGPKRGVEYFLAMRPFRNLNPGDAADGEFIRAMGIKTGLIEQVGKGFRMLDEGEPVTLEELSKTISERGEVYEALKAAVVANERALQEGR